MSNFNKLLLTTFFQQTPLDDIFPNPLPRVPNVRNDNGCGATKIPSVAVKQIDSRYATDSSAIMQQHAGKELWNRWSKVGVKSAGETEEDKSGKG